VWRCPVDKTLVAQKIRNILEKRIARVLDIKPHELPRLKLGTLAHTIFLLEGTGEELGGFNTTMSALLQLVGHEILWDIEPKEEESEASAPEEVIN
jgi:hypothetical protein